MAEAGGLRRASFRGLLLLVAAAVVFFRVLPIRLGETPMPAPDILVLLIFAWLLRRPDYVPVWLIVGIGLLADVVFMRPLGLWTLLTLLACEILRRRGASTAERPFAVEWLLVSGTFLAMHVAQTAILGLTLAPQPPIAAMALELVVSVLAYPLVVVATVFGFGVRSGRGLPGGRKIGR